MWQLDTDIPQEPHILVLAWRAEPWLWGVHILTLRTRDNDLTQQERPRCDQLKGPGLSRQHGFDKKVAGGSQAKREL